MSPSEITPSSDNDTIPQLLTNALQEQANSSNIQGVSPEQMRRAALSIRNLEHGYHAMIPLYCKGAQCPMARACPLVLAGFDYMVNNPCPIEQHLMSSWVGKLCIDLQVNTNNSVEMNLVAELAKLSIYRMRISNRLAFEDFIKQQIVAVDDDGVPQYRDELHPAIGWEETLSRRELKLLDALLATRRSIAEVGAGSSTDPSTNAANMLAMLEKAKKNLAQRAETIEGEIAKPANAE